MIGWPRTLHAIRRCYIYFYYTSSPSPLFFAFISICKRLMNWLTIFCDDVYTRTQTSKSYRYICILKEYWKFCSWLRNKSLTYIQIETERAREREREKEKQNSSICTNILSLAFAVKLIKIYNGLKRCPLILIKYLRNYIRKINVHRPLTGNLLSTW